MAQVKVELAPRCRAARQQLEFDQAEEVAEDMAAEAAE
jgi:hypothetical protein